jgi:hypothetical protein
MTEQEEEKSFEMAWKRLRSIKNEKLRARAMFSSGITCCLDRVISDSEKVMKRFGIGDLKHKEDLK